MEAAVCKVERLAMAELVNLLEAHLRGHSRSCRGPHHRLVLWQSLQGWFMGMIWQALIQGSIFCQQESDATHRPESRLEDSTPSTQAASVQRDIHKYQSHKLCLDLKGCRRSLFL